MNDTRSLSSLLYALLSRRGVTISDVAELAGMSRQQVHAIVTGKIANPGIATVQRIVEAAGETMAEFYAGDD